MVWHLIGTEPGCALCGEHKENTISTSDLSIVDCKECLEIFYGVKIRSKCCNATITVGAFASECDECGNSVNPDTGEPYNAKTVHFGGIN